MLQQMMQKLDQVRNGVDLMLSYLPSGSHGSGIGEVSDQWFHVLSVIVTSQPKSYLISRRAEPPTEKEVLQSLALAQMKKINAAKLEENRRKEMIAAG